MACPLPLPLDNWLIWGIFSVVTLESFAISIGFFGAALMGMLAVVGLVVLISGGVPWLQKPSVRAIGFVVAVGMLFGSALLVKALTARSSALHATAQFKGKPAPELDFTDLEKKKDASLEDYKGKVVLLSIWATWCPVCISDMPLLDKLTKELGDKGLAVLGASDENKVTIEDFLAKRKHAWTPVYADPKAQASKAYLDANGPRPITYLIDREGILRQLWVGPIEEREVRAEIEKYL